jgi:hypothetical protein
MQKMSGTAISTTGVARGSTAGGGGKDYESLENVLELVLQVIVYYSHKSCDDLLHCSSLFLRSASIRIKIYVIQASVVKNVSYHM